MDHPRSDSREGVAGVIFTDNLDVNKDAAGKVRSFEYSE